MKRLMIIGGSATGKSTLARVVGNKLNLPVVHLDRHYWSPGWVATEATEWRRRVAELAAGDAWVMDGNYFSTLDLRLPRAQALVWLDLPRRIYFPRAIRRLVSNYGRQREDVGPGCPERLDLDFLLGWVWRYPTRSRPRTLKLVRDLAGAMPVAVLSNPRQVAAFTAGLPASLDGRCE